MASYVQTESAALQSDLFDNLYCLDEYMRALGRAHMRIAAIDQHEYGDSPLMNMWIDFHAHLPCVGEIQRPPFQRLILLLECFQYMI